MEQRIKMHCETCHAIHDLRKTPELPSHVFVMYCNWCPLCEDRAEEYYEEWWDDDEDGANGKEPVMPVSDNQLCFPFIFDELNIPKHKEQPA